MGVNLKPILSGEEIRLSELRGRWVGIDAFNIIYQFLTSIRQPDGTPLIDENGRITSHLSGLFYRSINFMENGIKPVYVFDGEPPEFKRETIEERTTRKHEAEVKYLDAVRRGSLEEMRLFAQQSTSITPEIVQEAKQLLEYMGIPIIQAPAEGEAQAAVMASRGDVYAAVSQDYDSLLFGSPILIRNLSITGRRKLPRRNEYVMVYPERIYLKENLERLGLTRERLVWIAVLVGTDYNQGIKGIGPKTALKLVKKYDDFDELLKYVEGKYGMGLPYNIDKIIEYFLNPPSTTDYSLKLKRPDENKIVDFLCEEHDFSVDRVENGLNKLRRALENQIQQTTLF